MSERSTFWLSHLSAIEAEGITTKAYAEREGLSPGVQALCDYVVKIPTRFSVNLGTAGALVMYDRVISLGRHAPRPVAEGAPTEAVELPVFGEPMYKRRLRLRQKAEAKQ